MDKRFERRYPVGAVVDRRTSEVDLQYQSGDDHAFSGVLLPLLKVGQMVMAYERGDLTHGADTATDPTVFK